MLGKHSQFFKKHPASVSGELVNSLPVAVYRRTWMERTSIANEPALQPSAVSDFELRGRLGKSMELIWKEVFEYFAFDWVCATEGRLTGD